MKCSDEELIHNVDQCKLAISYLRNRGSDVVFRRTEVSKNWPKGCYEWKGQNRAYWNNHTLGASRENAIPICHKG